MSACQIMCTLFYHLGHEVLGFRDSISDPKRILCLCGGAFWFTSPSKGVVFALLTDVLRSTSLSLRMELSPGCISEFFISGAVFPWSILSGGISFYSWLFGSEYSSWVKSLCVDVLSWLGYVPFWCGLLFVFTPYQVRPAPIVFLGVLFRS